MTDEPESARRMRRRPAGTGGAVAPGQPRAVITVLDCTLAIRKRRLEMFILIGAGVVLEAATFSVPSLLGVASEATMTKAATGALSASMLLPFKLAFDRFSEASFFGNVRETLEQGYELSEFMLAELAKLMGKRTEPQ